MDIGENVKTWRHQRGLSQWGLADKSGVGYATIARVELGLVDPRLSTLRRLAEALEIRLVDFFEEPRRQNRPARKRARGK